MELNQIKKIKSSKVIIASIIILLVAIIAIWYFVFYKKSELSMYQIRQQELQDLAEHSKPVTATEQERVSDLNKLNKSSTTTPINSSDRLKELESLAK